jgi:hypothetical protein
MHSKEMVVDAPFYAVPLLADFTVNIGGEAHLARRMDAAMDDTGIGLPMATTLSPYIYERRQMVLTDDGQELGLMAWARVTLRLDIDREHVMAGNCVLINTRLLRDCINCDPFALSAEDLFWAATQYGWGRRR